MFVVQPDSKRRRGWFRLQTFFLGFVLLSLWALLWLFASEHFGVATDRAYGLFAQVDAVLGGCGLRWGCSGAHAQQITSPLYFSVLLLLGRLGLDLLYWSQMIGALAMAAALTLYTRMVCHRDWHQQNLKAPIIAGLGFLVMLGSDHWLLQGLTAGTEIGLACLAVALVLRAAADAHQRGLAFWLALALLLRPEAILFCLAAPLLFARARSPRFWWPVGASAVAIALFYGAWFPGVGWGALFGPAQDQAAPGATGLLPYLSEFPWLLLAPVPVLLSQQARLVRYTVLAGLLWLILQLASYDGYSLNANALPVTLPLFALGWIGLFVLLGKLSDRFRFPSWAEVLMPWVAAVFALTSMTFYWHSHHIPRINAKKKKTAPPVKALAQKLKKRYHPTRPIATTAPGLLYRATRRPVTPITTRSFKRGKGKEYIWRSKPQPSTIITGIWQPHEWNGRPLSIPASHPADAALLRLAQKQLIDYHIANIKLGKKKYWVILKKIE